ncbi:MAG: hypothetical protein M3N48_07145 [Verrucomicrobiota bacterium]|nr:hypothetical protein [Verrucomicrobiota bacterium]
MTAVGDQERAGEVEEQILGIVDVRFVFVRRGGDGDVTGAFDEEWREDIS